MVSTEFPESDITRKPYWHKSAVFFYGNNNIYIQKQKKVKLVREIREDFRVSCALRRSCGRYLDDEHLDYIGLH